MRLPNITYAACALAFVYALTTPIPAYAQVGAQSSHTHKAHVHHFMTATAHHPRPMRAVAFGLRVSFEPASRPYRVA